MTFPRYANGVALASLAIFTVLSQLHFGVAHRNLLSKLPLPKISNLTAAVQASSSLSSGTYEATQYLHAACAVFLDNSTTYRANSAHGNGTVLYRGMTATVTSFSASSVHVPWSFQLSSSPPGYSAIEQAYNFVNSSVDNGLVSGTATESYLTLSPKAGNNVTLGLLLEANATTFPLPQAFSLNNRSCSVVVLPDDVPPPANITTPPLDGVQASAGSGLTTLNGQIIDQVSGEPVELRGFNYFGFDNAQTCVDGLWAGSTTLSHDLATIMRTQQALGFNAVRLLTSFGTIFGLAPVPQSRACTSVSAADYQSYLTDPGATVAAGATIPELAYTPPTTEGICSDYLDSQPTSLDRYIFVISLFARNGFYVVLDNQLNDDPTLINEGQDVWLGYWRQIATAVAADEYAVNKVIIDGLNEPDSYGIRWEATATRPGYGALLLALMDALYPIIPGSLFFVEGTAQECNGGPSVNWGDGFASQPAVLAEYTSCTVSNPGPTFFEPLLTRPYLDQVVISPHVYGPSISLSTGPVNSGPALWNRLSQSFGYLNLVGYGGHVFPIAIGEFGSTLTQSADVTFFTDLSSYLRNEQADGTPIDALHNPISSFFWFAWNANSGDTGGLVNPPNWDTIVWPKIEYLQTLGLAPWYTGAGPTTVVPGSITTPVTPIPPTAPTPAATSAPVSTPTRPLTPGSPANTPAPVNPELTPGVSPVATPSPSALATTPSLTQAPPQLTPVTTPSLPAPVFPAPTTPAPTVSPPASPPVQSACSYWGSSGSYWSDPISGPYLMSVSLSVSNIGTETVPIPWTVTIASSAYTHLQYSWNWQIDAAGLQNGVVSGPSVFDWQSISPGASIDVGFIASISDPAAYLPESISINGLQCSFISR